MGISLIACSGMDTGTNIGAWCVLDRLQWSTGLACFDRTAGMPRYPFLPHRPPGGLNQVRRFEPFSRALGKVWVLPVAILTARWADDASDVARIGEHELNWPFV